jgi:hypothetical protein
MLEFVADLTNQELGHVVAQCGKLLGWSPSSIKVGVAISIIVAPVVVGVDRTLALSRVSNGYVYLKSKFVLL